MELSKRLAPQWVEFELEAEVDGEKKVDKVEFLCAPLTAGQFLNLTPYLVLRHETQVALLNGDGALLACRYAVRDWRGITENGAPVPFSEAKLAELFIPLSRSRLLRDLSTEIIYRSGLSEIERKN